MADYVTGDGREISFNLNKISIREYRALFDPKQAQAEEDATICKVSDLSLDEYLDISLSEQKLIWRALFEKARSPLTDPNSVSAST